LAYLYDSFPDFVKFLNFDSMKLFFHLSTPRHALLTLQNQPFRYPCLNVYRPIAVKGLKFCPGWNLMRARNLGRMRRSEGTSMGSILDALAFLALTLPSIGVSAARTPQLPRMRVFTRLVQIGVIVREKNGTIPDLTKDDFTIFDRGKRRDISVFTPESVAMPHQPTQALPRNTFSDLPGVQTSPPRSVTIVLLDNLNTLYGSTPQDQYESTPFWVEGLALQRARAHLLEFLKTLDPRDRVAIYGLRDSLHVLCDFTSDRAQLLAIVSKYDTSSATNRAVVEPARRTAPLLDTAPVREAVAAENGAALNLAGMANEERAQITMAALASIANHVANIPGRKNLVWLTAELPFSGAAMAHILAPANIAVYPVDARGLLARQTPTSAILTGTADADDVSGASGHWDNMPGQSSVPIGIPTMQKLAEETGGQAFVNTNDITGAIRKAVEDSAVSYTLGFYIDRDSIDGKFHELKVEIKRKGLRARYPKGYFAYEDTPVTRDENQRVLTTAVRSPIESSAIPVAARIERVEKPLPHSLSIFGTIDIHSVNLAQSGLIRKGSVEVVTIEQDETGKIVAQSGSTIDFRLSDEKYAQYLETGFPFHQYVEPRADASTLRIVVEDTSTARVGSLVIPLFEVK
jgi:VWFA-related protein